MHESVFTYSLAKPYPYRWFTWFVIIGGIAATALFSIVNLVATGYEPSNIYVTSPNDTENPQDRAWYQKRPWSWSNKVLSSCQSQTLLIGSEIFTINAALRYTLFNLSRPVRSVDDQRSSYFIAYHDDYTRDCVLTSINLAPSSTIDTSGRNILNIDARVNCLVYGNFVPVTATFWLVGSMYEDHISGPTGAYSFNGDKYNNTSTSLLMAAYPMFFYSMLRSLNSSGGWSFHDNEGNSLPTQNRSSLLVSASVAVSDLGYITIGSLSNVSASLWSSTAGDEMVTNGLLINDDSVITNMSDPLTSEAIYLDGLAKMLYSLILTDLGQSVEDNIFAWPEMTRHFLDKTARLASANPKILLKAGCMSSNMSEIVENEHLSMDEYFTRCGNGSLPRVDPTRIAQQYLCQVPKLKSTSSLVIGIIVADLVFLQALWTIVSWITTFFLERRDPTAHYCIGCAKTTAGQELDELEPGPNSVVASPAPPPTSPSMPQPLTTDLTMTSVHSASGRASVVSGGRIRRRDDVAAQPLLLSP